MTLEALIIDFNELKDRIATAAQNDNEVLLRSLDSDIQGLFLKILAHVPNSKQQRITHCEFLLEQLIPEQSRHGASQIIFDKIVSLISEP